MCAHVESRTGVFISVVRKKKKISLNSMIGTILSHDIASQRYGLRLLSGQEKSVKADRLLLYTPADEDRCPRCKEYINSNSFPPCDCTSSSIES